MRGASVMGGRRFGREEEPGDGAVRGEEAAEGRWAHVGRDSGEVDHTWFVRFGECGVGGVSWFLGGGMGWRDRGWWVRRISLMV